MVVTLAANAWGVVLSLVCIPIFLRTLGTEAFGLVGLFNLLIAALAFLDLGLASALQRECARSLTDMSTDKARELRELACTAERYFWMVALLLAVAGWWLSPVIASQWLSSSALPAAEVASAVTLLSLALVLRWPTGLYTNGLIGLERQVSLNLARIVFSSLQWLGAAALLLLVTADVSAFFAWQAIVGGGMTLWTGRAFWRHLPARKGVATWQSLKRESRFSLGVGASGILAFLVTQADKLLLSRLLSLESFGFYSLAHSLASGVNQLVGPVATAVFPRLTSRLASGETRDAVTLYHLGSQAFAAAALPLAVIIVLFPTEILALWTGSAYAAKAAALPLALLAAGMALNALLHFPQLLQLAHGVTHPSVYANAVAVIVYIPGLVWATDRFGLPGAAASWLALNVGYIAFLVPVAHRLVLRGELMHWLDTSLLRPIAIAVTVAIVARWLWPADSPSPIRWLALAATYCAAVSLSAVAAPRLRHWGWNLIRRAPRAP